jgi:RNA polymerase sigma factor (sigma-70 family)
MRLAVQCDDQSVAEPVRVQVASKSRKRRKGTPLTRQQRALVAKSLGLVGVHIATRVVRRDRHRQFVRRDHYADLFQAGCCGLVQAARSYRPDCGVDFPAYALPRIRFAIHEALRDRGLIHVPRTRSLLQKPTEGWEGETVDPETTTAEALPPPSAVRRAPRVFTLKYEAITKHHADHRQGVPDIVEKGEPTLTIGERILARYDAAVELAVKEEMQRDLPAPSRLLKRYLAERLRIPESGERTRLQRLARECRATISQVVELEKRMVRSMRRILSADCEFRLLREWARHAPRGMDEVVEVRILDEFRAAAAEDFWNRTQALPREKQQQTLLKLIEAAGADVIRAIFAQLPLAQADPLLTETLAAA